MKKYWPQTLLSLSGVIIAVYGASVNKGEEYNGLPWMIVGCFVAAGALSWLLIDRATNKN